MKKLFVTALIILSAIIISCAGTVEKKIELSAEYYETSITKTGVVSMAQITPAVDYPIVVNEVENGDDIEIKILWIIRPDNLVGVVFDDISTEAGFDYCGIMGFASEEGLDSFLGGNKDAIIGVQSVPCEAFQQILLEELNSTRFIPGRAQE